MTMLQCLPLSSMLNPSFLSNTSTSDLGNIIFSCMLGTVLRNEST
jgi:hypothetical protein